MLSNKKQINENQRLKIKAKVSYDNYKKLYNGFKSLGKDKDNDMYAKFIYLQARRIQTIYNKDKKNYKKYNQKIKDCCVDLIDADNHYMFNIKHHDMKEIEADEGEYLKRASDLKIIYEMIVKEDKYLNGKSYWDM